VSGPILLRLTSLFLVARIQLPPAQRARGTPPRAPNCGERVPLLKLEVRGPALALLHGEKTQTAMRIVRTPPATDSCRTRMFATRALDTGLYSPFAT
jgi:hypothetical protein